MNNHSEILKLISQRIKVYFQSNGDVEDDIWPPAREVIIELKKIIELAEPSVEID